MSKINVRILMPEEWHLIAEKYEKTFENAMPETPVQSVFYGVFNSEGEIIGFAHLEQVLHLNAVYFDDENKNAAALTVLFKFINQTLKDYFKFLPILTMPDKKLKRLLSKFNFREIGTHQVWRKDAEQ